MYPSATHSNPADGPGVSNQDKLQSFALKESKISFGAIIYEDHIVSNGIKANHENPKHSPSLNSDSKKRKRKTSESLKKPDADTTYVLVKYGNSDKFHILYMPLEKFESNGNTDNSALLKPVIMQQAQNGSSFKSNIEEKATRSSMRIGMQAKNEPRKMISSESSDYDGMVEGNGNNSGLSQSTSNSDDGASNSSIILQSTVSKSVCQSCHHYNKKCFRVAINLHNHVDPFYHEVALKPSFKQLSGQSNVAGTVQSENGLGAGGAHWVSVKPTTARIPIEYVTLCIVCSRRFQTHRHLCDECQYVPKMDEIGLKDCIKCFDGVVSRH